MILNCNPISDGPTTSRPTEAGLPSETSLQTQKINGELVFESSKAPSEGAIGVIAGQEPPSLIEAESSDPSQSPETKGEFGFEISQSGPTD